MQQIKFLLFFVGFGLLILGCDASKKAAKEQEKEDKITFGKAESQTLGKVANYQSLTLPKAALKAFFTDKFEDSKGFKDFNVVTKNEKEYYLISKGKRESDNAQFAIELEVTDGNLVLEDAGKLYYTCIARYCDACAFKYNSKGAISGCDCSEPTADKPEGIAPCEHTRAIKTNDKE